jgi:single-strand DNA-binding protein
MNVFNFTGNLGNEAEMRYTPNGDPIVNFSVAVKAGYGDKATTTWIRCAMWGKRGESVVEYLKKGTMVGVSGELSNREYQDKDGQKRYSLEVRVNDLTLIGGKQDRSEPSQEKAPQPAKAKPSFDDPYDDLPF